MNPTLPIAPPAEVRGQEPLAVARALVFSPTGGEGRVEQVVRRLGEAIGLGLLQVGDRLPSEPDLAERFGVAPMTLRQALAILREAGYLETRRGRGGGTFVRRAVPPTPRRRARQQLRSLTADELRDLTDYRAALAGAAAALAAARATQSELAALRELVDRMAGGPRYQEFRQADAHFHLALASAAKSARLTAAEASIQVEVGELMTLIPHPPEALQVSNAQHGAILAAIGRRDPDAARTLMERHVRGTGDFLVGLRLGNVGP
jgi:GntR family transcriptional regulator, transcriptional repressor for pyruvate dehydrogenase complex